MIRKLLKFVAILFALLVIAVVVLFLVFPLDEMINTQKDKYLPEIEKTLGRKVTVGEISTSFFPFGAQIKDIRVQGKTPEEEILLGIDKILFRVDVVAALLSAGSNVELDALIVSGLNVNLIREADGSLSYEDILTRLAEGAPPEEEAPEEGEPKPMDPEVRKFLENLKLKRIALENSRFRLVDKATGGAPAETFINDFSVVLEDVFLSSPFEVNIGAAIFAEQRNFELAVRVGPIPIGKEDAVVPIDWVTIKASGVELARITPYLGPDVPVKITSALFGADLRVDDPLAAKGRIRLKGEVSLSKLAVGAPEPGTPFDLVVRPNLDFNPVAGQVDLTGFSISLDDMVLAAKGVIRDIGKERPSFDDARIHTENFHLGRLFAMLPDAAAALPPGAKIDGPFGIDLAAAGDVSAQTFVFKADFDKATIIMPGAIHKGAGVPLHALIDAAVKPDDLNLKALEFAVGPMNLTAKGTVKDFGNPNFNITGGTGKFDINSLARLLPEVQKSIPPDVKIAGQAEVDLRAVGSGASLDALVKLGIYGADLSVPGTTVRGTGTFEVTAKGSPAGSIATRLNAALAGLDLRAGEDFIKPTGAPFDIRMSVDKAGQVVKLGELVVNLGPLNLTGGGTANLGTGVLDIKANIARFSVGELAKMVPALGDGPLKPASLGMGLGFSGDPNRASTVKADLTDFYFGVGPNVLTGRASIENLDAPKIRFDFNSPNFNVDQVFPPSGEPAAADEGGGGLLPPIVQVLDVQGNFRIAKGQASEFPFTNFVASMTMKSGVVNFSKMDFDSYGGKFTAAPTTLDLSGAKPRFDLSVAFRNVDTARLLKEQTDMKKDSLSGRMTTEFKLKGQGDAWEEISQTLTGTLGMQLKNGRLAGLNLEGGIIDPLAAKLPMVKRATGPGGTALNDLAGTFRVADGKMTLEKPMVAKTPQGPMEFTGHIGLDTTLALKGTIDLAPATIAKATQNKVKPSKPTPVGLRIGGTITDPKIDGVEVDALAKELASALGLAKLDEARDKAEAMAREKAAQAEAMARAKAAEAQAQALAAKNAAMGKANEAKAEAERKKKEAEAKAKAEADRRKKEAEEKAKKEAKKKAGGKVKGLF